MKQLFLLPALFFCIQGLAQVKTAASEATSNGIKRENTGVAGLCGPIIPIAITPLSVVILKIFRQTLSSVRALRGMRELQAALWWAVCGSILLVATHFLPVPAYNLKG